LYPGHEFSHIKRWADTNGLIINCDKTKELVLHRPHVTRHNLPQSLAGIEQVLTARLLGVIFQSSLSFAAHAFSALTLLVGRQEGHQACKKTRVMGCWHGYLSGVRCRLAYGPADAIANHCLLLQ